MSCTAARSLARSGCAGALNYGALCLQPGKKCWVLHVDGLVLNDDGAVLDALSMGMRVRRVRVQPWPAAAGGE